ncbi:nuclear transport factor 2 family protein [Pseudooceanicola sp. CBS1P-1]|uniref:Nuclear transport factor 2 family protein n=1 Tax=Pseudooceanicola albus TaxID=2692189 RepID=A0A6L7GAB0_9RHOB|nr:MULTISPECIES: nuclear transport factor 2 family protein [Pseudooceanicola]MBT9386494.1 nuclear transport factor 2 family protein [Pseudooceanicola endophyticus]MXN20527.1 nuclear transport factor 2 family protein [Pseudooceanicola albus]
MTDALAPILARLERLEAEAEIRRCLSDYMDICDRLTAASDLDALGALFTRGAVWGGAGDRYAKDFGAHHGRRAIIDWLGRFCTTPPHFASNAHFLTSEALRWDADACEGRWIMLQTPSFHDGQSFVMAARLTIRFEKEEGRWRMAVFQTENLYARPVGAWNQPVQIPQPPATALT